MENTQTSKNRSVHQPIVTAPATEALYRQASDHIGKAAKILIALPTAATIDYVCSAYALYSALQKLGKNVTVASSAPVVPVFNFLANPPEILTSISADSTTVIELLTSNAQLAELSYQTDDDAVRIFLKPSQGQFMPEDVTVLQNTKPYDLVIILGAHNLESLGSLYKENSPLFFEKPKIVIDDNPSNEYFGSINIVEVTASSITEILYQLVSALEPSVKIDEEIATALLAGMVASTQSFQDPATTPKTFITASELIAHGARQQDVINYLYKTKEFSLLKLWGRALARIKTDPAHSLLYSQLTRADFEKTGESIDRLELVLKEILENISEFQLVVLIAETETGVRMLIAGLPHIKVESIAAALQEFFEPAINIFGLYQRVVLDLKDTSLEQAELKLQQAVLSVK